MANTDTFLSDKAIPFIHGASGTNIVVTGADTAVTAGYLHAGTIYPANDDTAVGIVLDTVKFDNTTDSKNVTIASRGTVYASKLPELPTEEAITNMRAVGNLIFMKDGEPYAGEK
jgi:hypothetical protein